MREILYKGFHKDENGTEKIFVDGKWVKGEWVYGYYIRYGWTHQEKDYIVPLYASALYAKEVIPSTVGQFTGLTDKNGKKIFDGDIIDTPDRLIKVVWLTGNAQFDLNFIRYANDIIITNFKGIHMRDLKEYEIIGNIHDNPELLERSDNNDR